MPEKLYELSTGFDNNNLLNLRIDTFERMNKLQENLNIPDYKPLAVPKYEPFIPKDLNSDVIVKGSGGGKLPQIKDGLLSDDPRIVELTKQYIDQKAASSPMTAGIGITQTVPYVEGQNKFTNKNIFKGKRQTMFGYNPYVSMEENEDFNHEHVWNSYSNLGKVWRGVSLFAGRAVAKAVTGLVGMVGDLGAIAWNGLQELGDLANINNGTKNNFWYDVSNNWLARKMEEADEHINNQWLPTYKALNYDNKGAWQKLMDPYTWTNSFADGVGFLLQFVAPGIVLGKLAQAGKIANNIGELEKALVIANEAGETAKAAKIAQTIAEAKNVGRFTKAMGYEIKNTTGKNIAEFLTGSNNIGGITAHAANTMLEAVSETKEGFKNTVDDLMKKGMSREKAIEIAGNNAPAQFWLNAGILIASNAFENKLLQKAINNRKLTTNEILNPGTIPIAKQATTKVGKFFEANPWGNRLKFYGTNAAKATFWEGFWEENAQTAAQRYAAGYYTRHGDDGDHVEKTGSFIQQLWKQTKDAIKGNDREAADSIMAGAVIGILGSTTFSKLAGTTKEIKDDNGNIVKPKTFLPEGQRKLELREKAQKVSEFINLRDAWLSIKAFDADMYDKDGNIIKDKLDKKVNDIKEKIASLNSKVANSITAEQITDPQYRDELQHRLFASYVKAHILNETGDALVERLKNWDKKSKADELSLYGVTEEARKDSAKWANIAEELVTEYNNNIKDLKHAAPSDTEVDEYFKNTTAIKSIIYDYVALRNMSKRLSSQYQDLMNEENPFAEYLMLQDYNENQIKLIKLKQKLENEDLDVVERELVEKHIKQIEEDQKLKKETFSGLGETITDKMGLVFPKETDVKKQAEKIAQHDTYFDMLNRKVDHDINAEKFDAFIKEYSNEKTGYAKYMSTTEFWDSVYNKEAEEKVKKEAEEKAKKDKATLEKEIADLKSTLSEAKTKEERDKIAKDIEDKEKELEKINDELEETGDEKPGKTKTETPEETAEDEIIDVPPPPPDVQYGVDEYIEQALAYVTPFKTVNKETVDAKDDEGNRLSWKEYVIEHGYDHDLTMFAKHFLHTLAVNPNKYEIFVIKDTEEMMKERLSKKQLEAYEEGSFKPGAIVVFREKGKTEWLRFSKSKKIIAFSYNEFAFNSNYQERIRINEERTGRTKSQVIEHFKRQQLILEAVREKVISENVQIQLKSESGSLGVYPTTEPDAAVKRFAGFYDNENPFIIIKSDNKNLIPGSKEGEVYLHIPDVNTVDGKPFYIPVYTSKVQKGEPGSLQEKIYNSLQAIQLSTFKTAKEASDVIRNYLYNFFYVGDINKFEIRKVAGGFKIVYANKDGEHLNWLNIPSLKLSDKLYNTEAGLSLYEKKDGIFQPTEKISKEQYRDFIHNHLITRRKVLIQHIENKGNKIYTAPVNAYLNLQAINETDIATGDATKTTEEALAEPIIVPITSSDIVKRRQEDFNNENESYRVIVGDDAFNDIVESGVVRTNAESKNKKEGGIDLSNRPTAYPSFSKGKASMEYAAANPNNYIIVTEDSSIQPSKVGRHGKGTTMFPTDKNGNHLKELSGEKVKVYKHIGNGEYVLVYANGKEINAEYEAKKADIEKLEKEKQEALQPLIEEKEQIEKEIEEIEKDSKSSKTNSQEIESLKEKIKDLRNTDGTIPENKLNEFRSLRKQIQFLESDILHNINKAINEFISDNNLTEKDKKLIYALAEIRDNFQEVIDEFNEKRNSNYTLSEIMTFFGSSFNLQESIETETETDNKKAHEYENKLLEGNGFKANEDYTADELNDFVQKHGSKQVKFIWNLIKAVAQKLGVTTRFMLQGNSKIPVGAAGHYLNGKIENRASLFSHPESAARIIVHELVHGVTTYILKAVEQNNTKILSKLTTRQLKAVEKLNALFDELKKDKEFDDTYGTKNTHELLAELTNENFVDKLKSKNVFEKILEAIFEIFNIPFNAYNESVKILEDLISNPLEDNRYEGSLGEGYSLYSKSESTKLQQLKQKLAEVNKKINEVTKRFNAQIAQKQAELKALEQQPTSNQSEIEAKKADIERRRQEIRGEALEKIGVSRVGYDGKQRQDWKDAKNQDLKIATNHAIERLSKNPNIKIASLPSTYANAIKAELEIHGVNTSDKTSISEIIEKLKEINTKYDEELESLNNQTVEQQKADIERKRQEELFTPIKKNTNDITEQVYLSSEEGRRELVNIIKYLAEGHSKKSTAQLFNTSESDIQKIRNYLSIPSRTTGSTYAGQIGTDEEIKEAENKFKKWKEKIDKINAEYDLKLVALEKENVTPSEFKELVRLAKFFLENPKEPTVVGSVVSKYPELFKVITYIETRRQNELKAVPVGSSTMYKYVKDGENTELTKGEEREVEELIQAFIENGERDANRVISYLQKQGFIRGPYVGPSAQKAYIEARLNGTNIPVNARVQESINARFDAELAALEKENQTVTPTPAVSKPTITNVIDEDNLSAPQEIDVTSMSPIDELKEQIKHLKETLAGTKTPLVSKALKKKIEELEEKLKQLESAEKPQEEMSTVEKLKAVANEVTPESRQSSVVIPHVFEGSTFKVDFDNDIIDGMFDEITPEYVQDFFDSFPSSIYEKLKLENNGINYYFLKHKRLAKFVSFDSSLKFLKVSELPQEILNNERFKKIENCE